MAKTLRYLLIELLLISPAWAGYVPPTIPNLVSSTFTTTATLNGTTTIVLASAGDFLNGETIGIALAGSGPTSTPSGCTCATNGVTGFTPGTITYNYSFTTISPNLSESVPSATCTQSSGSSVLGANGWNLGQCNNVVGALGYKAYGCKGVNCVQHEQKYIPAINFAGQTFFGYADVGDFYATETIGKGDGSTQSFSYTLGKLPAPLSLTITVKDTVCIDGGSGNFASNTAGSVGCDVTGTINDATGALVFKTTNPPPKGQLITANYALAAQNTPQPPTSGTLNWSLRKIVSGGGTVNLVLDAAPIQIGNNFVVVHNNTPAIQTYLNTLGTANGSIPAGGIATIGRGFYQYVPPLILPSQVTLAGDCGGTNYGTGSDAPSFDYGTTLANVGPDGLDTLDAYDGLRMGVQCINFDNQFINGLITKSTALVGIHADTSATSASGNDKMRVEKVSVVGGLRGLEVGGNVIISGAYPNGDISEFYQNSFHFNGTNNLNMNTEGVQVNSSNAGFISQYILNQCLGNFNRCFDVKSASEINIQSLNAAINGGNNGVQPVGIWWEEGAGGSIQGIETEGMDSLRVPITEPQTPFPLNLIANRFNGAIEFNGVDQINSIGNDSGGNNPTWSMNGNLAQTSSPSVISMNDKHQWVKGTGATGQLTSCNKGVCYTVPDLIANLPAAAAVNEGSVNTQTNSTAACSAGATATNAGTTHCQIRSNGTNWIQTGF